VGGTDRRHRHHRPRRCPCRPLPHADGLSLVLILGIAGFLGDITMSAMKRDLGVKDTGGLIPGHGGILDRVDSLTYAAPVFVHFVRYFFYP
jgi:phosphatidate cytidylyltransferase